MAEEVMPVATRLLMLVLLAACASPSPRFDGPARKAVVSGHSFDIYVGAGQAEALRTNVTWLPDTAEVMAAAVVAVEQTTGCSVPLSRVRGDAAIVRMPITCP